MEFLFPNANQELENLSEALGPMGSTELHTESDAFYVRKIWVQSCSPTPSPCYRGHIPSPLWASVSPPVKGGNSNPTFLRTALNSRLGTSGATHAQCGEDKCSNRRKRYKGQRAEELLETGQMLGSPRQVKTFEEFEANRYTLTKVPAA